MAGLLLLALFGFFACTSLRLSLSYIFLGYFLIILNIVHSVSLHLLHALPFHGLLWQLLWHAIYMCTGVLLFLRISRRLFPAVAAPLTLSLSREGWILTMYITQQLNPHHSTTNPHLAFLWMLGKCRHPKVYLMSTIQDLQCSWIFSLLELLFLFVRLRYVVCFAEWGTFAFPL